MASSTSEPEIIRVSQKGQATIPQRLREKFGIDTPGEVLVYEDEGRIIVEPLPPAEDLHGIHAGEHEPGEVLEKVREVNDEEKQREEEIAERLRPDEDAE
ncbi:AbrB/MazE/SpoVT family DNA-binding domain-containing protein [Halococcus thailandensis]|uniref:Transcription regulator n=1 Tax=Halococcus thailandensis JCM 13552 TaxID=1227457 RepID=M0NE70_9EURY|nr:AbrB/MazE/SpoVT family DNA-binding domain-containing protein [Halococcus thailandensis]EMA56136.1 transcription regulator [Halococcus thailandensis JCM 13552]